VVGFRYYDPVLGRFLTRDPAGYPDGPNNYLYCNNNPINHIDPLGLWGVHVGGLKLGNDKPWLAFDRDTTDAAARGGAAMTKVVAGVAEVAAGAAITVKTGGLAAAGGVAMAVDGASRAQGGVADFANLFRSPESQLGNWDTVEVGFQQALGPELGTAVRESTSAVLTFGTSALVAGGGSPAAAKAPAKPATTAEAPETTADAIRKGAEGAPRSGPYKPGDVLPDGRIAGDGPGAALRGSTGGRMTPDQQALKELVDDATLAGRKPLSAADAETVLDWADEVSYPRARAGAGDVTTPSNWAGRPGHPQEPHIHIPGVGSGHIPVDPGVAPRK